MRFPTHFAARALAVALIGLLACSNDDDPTAPTVDPPLGLQLTATGSSSVRIAFNGRAIDDSYTIERAEGATGAFASVTTVNAPATDGTVTYDDTGLNVSTQYRYRVKATRGSASSTYGSEQTTTTLAPGAFARTVTGDITTNTTWYRDTTYTLNGFIHVANGATLTIEAGTTIKGDFNTVGSSLFVLRGAKIMAIGTAALPIVFTSSQPVGQRKPGDWGGLIIVGNGDSEPHGCRQSKSKARIRRQATRPAPTTRCSTAAARRTPTTAANCATCASSSPDMRRR